MPRRKFSELANDRILAAKLVALRGEELTVEDAVVAKTAWLFDEQGDALLAVARRRFGNRIRNWYCIRGMTRQKRVCRLCGCVILSKSRRPNGGPAVTWGSGFEIRIATANHSYRHMFELEKIYREHVLVVSNEASRKEA